MSEWSKDDVLLAMIREFSIGNAITNTTTEAQRECIRISILAKQRDKLPFFDSGMSYAQAYTYLYNKPIDLRRFPRDFSHLAAPIEDEEDEDDEEESV